MEVVNSGAIDHRRNYDRASISSMRVIKFSEHDWSSGSNIPRFVCPPRTPAFESGNVISSVTEGILLTGSVNASSGLEVNSL